MDFSVAHLNGSSSNQQQKVTCRVKQQLQQCFT